MARNIQVLLVDENEKSRMTLRRQLSLAGYAVVGESGYGQEAQFLARELKPDVILVSVEEPVIRPLKTIESYQVLTPAIPVMAVSSLQESGHVRKSMLAGARNYLIKPLNVEALQAAIATLLRQEERRRQTMAPDAPDVVPTGCLITVFGAKGGIGKTTLAVNLATCLALANRQRVALVDLDFVFGGAAVMLDLQPRRPMVELARRGTDLDAEALDGFLVRHESGVALFALGVKPEETPQVTPEIVGRVLELLLHRYDYVVVDTPPALNPVVMTALERSAIIALVTSLDVACVKNTRASLYMMRTWELFEERVKVIINRANSANSLRKDDIESVLEHPVFWKIPHDPEVAMASQTGSPVVLRSPHGKATRTIQELMSALTGVSRPQTNVWQRLFSSGPGKSE